MNSKIDILRTVANNLTSHLIMEGKTKITKPGAIIPGAVAVAGTVVTLETKDNKAKLVVKKDNNEIQKSTFNYNETPDGGYELVSAQSSYSYNDKGKKEIRQNQYSIEQGQEKAQEKTINYANAPIKATTQEYIDKINSSVAQISGYKSEKTEYDSLESHTYGKKSLNRDIPALLQLLEVVAPESEFTLKMKDKLKKDNVTSLVAFEASDVDKGNEIVRGFMSANGDSVSYHIDTNSMTIVGEQSRGKSLSKTYLKGEKTQEQKTEAKNDVSKKDIKNKETEKNNIKASKPSDNEKVRKKDVKTNKEQKTKVSASEQKASVSKTKHAHSEEYYANLIFDVVTNLKIPTQKKVEMYKQILSNAYSDGYNKAELENILSGNGLHKFSYYCRRTYIDAAIAYASASNTQKPVKSLEDKMGELKNIKLNIEEEELKECFQNMINELDKEKDKALKEKYANKALNIINSSSSEDLESDILTFVQEARKINDDFKLHYEIYAEAVYAKNMINLKMQIKQMINNISDANYRQRDEFLSNLYVAKDIQEMEKIQSQVQELLNNQNSQRNSNIVPEKEQNQIKAFFVKDLSSANQKLVMKLLNCKSPRAMSLSFNEVKNLLLDIGFTEGGINGTHYKFVPPAEIQFNGRKQPFLTVAYQGSKFDNAALIDDLINVCRQYYGDEQAQ